MPCSSHNGLESFMKLKFKQIENYEAQQRQSLAKVAIGLEPNQLLNCCLAQSQPNFCTYNTVGFQSIEIAKKVFLTFDNVFHVYLMRGFQKYAKKLNSHDGFLSYLLNSTANSAHLAAHFCPAQVCPHKATMRIQFLPYFWNPLIKQT